MTERMSAADYRAAKAGGGSRFAHGSRGSIQIGPLGFKMRSKAEVAFANELDVRSQRGEIRDWFYGVSIPFGLDENGKQRRYVVDFMVIDPEGRIVWIDVKGKGNPQDSNRAKRDALRLRGVDVKVEQR